MKDINEIIKEVSNSPMRSSIITANALIESFLEKLIVKYFIILRGEERKEIFKRGCLSTLSAKNKIAYALGLISKELYKDINSYREIRNKCAHEYVLDDRIMQFITDKAKQFNLLKSCFSISENEKIKAYTTIEFAIILRALKKRINNIKRCEECKYEAHDDYLKFDNDECHINDIINNDFHE